MQITQYNIISLDGYVAYLNGREDFIPDEMWQFLLDLCRENDAIILGKNTYLAIQDFPDSLKVPFEKLSIKKIVVSRDKSFVPKNGYCLALSPMDAIRGSGEKILLNSGGNLNTSFLSQNMIDRIIIYVLPVIIGRGIKLFDNLLQKQVNLVLEQSKITELAVRLTYKVVK